MAKVEAYLSRWSNAGRGVLIVYEGDVTTEMERIPHPATGDITIEVPVTRYRRTRVLERREFRYSGSTNAEAQTEADRAADDFIGDGRTRRNPQVDV